MFRASREVERKRERLALEAAQEGSIDVLDSVCGCHNHYFVAKGVEL